MNGSRRHHGRAVAWALVALALAAPSVGCSRRRAARRAGVTPLAQAQPERIPAGSAFRMTYRWAVEPGAVPLPRGSRAFVHFVHPDGALVFADDHVPSPTPADWRPGQTCTYSHTLFVPRGSFESGPLQVRVGLFDDGGRLALSGQDVGLNEYAVGSIEVLPADPRAALRYGAGWYAPDAPAGDPFGHRRWMAREASLSFRNRGQDVIVLVWAETRFEAFSAPPVLTLQVGSAAARIPVRSSARFTAAVRFSSKALGDGRWADLRLAMSGSFVPPPAGRKPDTRELALWVHNVFVGAESEVAPALSSSTTPIDAVVEAAPAPAKP